MSLNAPAIILSGVISRMGFSERIKSESAVWIEKSIITEEQRREIIALYKSEPKANPVFMLFAIIGALLTGTGVILVFATNWWKIPLMAKILIAYAPLAVAMGIFMFTLLKKRDSSAFSEGSSLFLTLSIFAAIALIGQIFHSPKELDVYLTTCILLSLPAVYIMNSRAAAAVYVAGALWVGITFSESTIFYQFVAMLILPYIIYRIIKTEGKNELWYLLLLLTAIAPYFVVKMFELSEAFVNYDGLSFPSSSEKALICGVTLVVLDAAVWLLKEDWFFSPPKLFGLAVIALVFVLSSFPEFSDFSDYNPAVVALAALALLYAFIRYRTGVRKPLSADLFVASSLLLNAIGFYWLAASGILVIIGVYYIYFGSRRYTLKHLNLGMTLLIFVIAARFFDSGLSILMRGIAFIALGVCFLSVNFIIYRRKRVGGENIEK